MPDTLLGIDLGTTVLKLGLFHGVTGKVIASAFRRLPVASSEPGAREIATRALDSAIRIAVHDLRNAARPHWHTIAGIGLSAQGGSSIIADRNSGKALTPMVLWNDERCHPHVRQLAALKQPSYWSGLVSYAVPPTGLARLMWLRERYAALYRDDTIHIGAGEYVFHALTGLWRQDPGNAIQIGSYNAYKKALDPKAFKLVGIPLSFVAPLRQGHEIAALDAHGARLLGLKQGVPVAGPYIDQEAGYMSLMETSRRPLHCSLGTAWVGNFTLEDADTWTSPTQMLLPSPTGEGRLILQALPTGNLTWDWALRTFLGDDSESAQKIAAQLFTKKLLPKDGINVLPWFTQANPHFNDCSGGGGILGLSADTPPDEIVRAVAAGLVFEMYRFLESVVEQGHHDVVVINGGASQAMQFRKLIAAMFDPIPIHWQRDYNLSAARGALYALAPRVARASTLPLPTMQDAEVRNVKLAYERYKKIFRMTYGASPEAGGYRL